MTFVYRAGEMFLYKRFICKPSGYEFGAVDGVFRGTTAPNPFVLLYLL